MRIEFFDPNEARRAPWERPTWDESFLRLSRTWASLRADCVRRKVAAIIVDEADHSIVTTGYNGAERGGPSCLAGQCPRAFSSVAPGSSYDTGPGACVALHAEQNAMLEAGRRACVGKTLYITEEPCDGCQKMIKAVGIERVVVWQTITSTS